MSDTTKKQPDRREQRQARLEEALRENLKKRKALARKKTAAGSAADETGPAGSSDTLPED